MYISKIKYVLYEIVYLS